MISTTTFHTQLDIAEKRVHDYIDAMVYQWELRERKSKEVRDVLDLWNSTGVLLCREEDAQWWTKQFPGSKNYHIDLKKFISESSN